MRILVIGSGGREHALVWKLSQSPKVKKVFIAPGNGGTEEAGENVPISATDIPALVEFAQREKIDLVVPGPEAPLVAGIADELAKAGIACFGPDAWCSQLEGSKSFAKKIMAEAGVPTPASAIFTDADAAIEFVKAGPERVVIKADGLAAGKGVVVADTREEAIEAITQMLTQKRFGDAGSKILIEERLDGEEVSLLCLCDDLAAVPLASAQDHKAAFDHDQGPNTGGMGAYSPAPLLRDSDLEEITDLVIRPILKTLKKHGHPFRGVLYAGLMLTSDGPKVLEYNVRFGDPECQPLMMRMTSDLASHLNAAWRGELAQENITYRPESALCVVLAANGYPGEYAKDLPINGVNEAESLPGVKVFHSGTKKTDAGLISSGGRVLGVTAIGKTLPRAQETTYEALEKIEMPGGRYRRDIGQKAIRRMLLEH